MIDCDGFIIRTYFGVGQTEEDELEIGINFKVEEYYTGTGDVDDPSHCVIDEYVKVAEDVGPFRRGDLLLLTEDEREGFEQEEYNRWLEEQESDRAEGHE